MNITEKAVENLIKHYSLKNASQLAEKFGITQGVISNWKTRNGIGALVDTVSKKDEKALSCIFNTKENNSTININNLLLDKVEKKASEYGLGINEYLTHLMLQDLEKNIQ